MSPDSERGGLSSGPELRLHIPHEGHDDSYGGTAVQGELFSGSVDDDLPKRGYRGTVASKVAGITYRQLDYWARKRILEPSITPSHGSGSRRLYSFKDVVILAVSKRLLDAGINLQNVTSAIGFLTQRTTAELGGITIMCDGETVHECVNGGDVVDVLNTGAAVFAVSVGLLWGEIRQALEGEECVELEDSAVDQSGSSSHPLDELTEIRLRRELAARHARRESA
ncbi:MerR family transcriptional regulator [uncultured Bifidobacterium sp.]|uniref:MerR family transcriptional regulator n=1 Tax=uncultured Bifidobacterium sp. TaxID=165187 RepID=UPI00261588C7|nr:MerR family transcriptional regulator [uncultured Bifidobacterium sp.]